MITHLQGRLVEKTPTNIVIDCNGVGYFVHISLHTFSNLSDTESVKLFIHLQVREDSHTLFGFSTKVEREIFRLLISVSGVGASIARTMLSSLTPDQVKDAIAQNDFAAIQSVKGIGSKTAQRVVLDLKDKQARMSLFTLFSLIALVLFMMAAWMMLDLGLNTYKKMAQSKHQSKYKTKTNLKERY